MNGIHKLQKWCWVAGILEQLKSYTPSHKKHITAESKQLDTGKAVSQNILGEFLCLKKH